jgi:2-polyprenyl-3-methyl-5-hydroxy-6-metoxy-1,4-benzoquinol methylase
MVQVNHGVRAVLAHPAIYNLFQGMVGANRMQREVVHSYLRPWAGARVLDIGCGTATVLDHMSGITYVGIDLSKTYIETAQARYGDRGTFYACDVAQLITRVNMNFDLILACGLLHHLDDGQAKGLLGDARKLMTSSGRLVTVDGSWVQGQSSIARFLLSRDRGRNVRSPQAYIALARQSFSHVKADVRHDVLRIPFTLCFLECSP